MAEPRYTPPHDELYARAAAVRAARRIHLDTVKTPRGSYRDPESGMLFTDERAARRYKAVLRLREEMLEPEE